MATDVTMTPWVSGESAVTTSSDSMAVLTTSSDSEAAVVEATVVPSFGPHPIDYKKKVCIVGFAGTSRSLVPYNDTSFEIWSLNNAWQFVPRWDVWFELHTKQQIGADFVREGEEQRGSARHEWLTRNHGKPIYMQQHHPEYPDSVAWPREELNKWFASLGGDTDGYYCNDYYTSTIAQMLALAIYQGYGEIHVYGVDMLQDEEYFYQHTGCAYYVAFARGRGHKVYIPRESALCKASYTYGYSEPPASDQFEMLADFFGRSRDKANEAMVQARCAAHLHEGRRQVYKELLQLPPGPVNLSDLAVKGLEAADKGRLDALCAANLHEGARVTFEGGISWVRHAGKGGVL